MSNVETSLTGMPFPFPSICIKYHDTHHSIVMLARLNSCIFSISFPVFLCITSIFVGVMRSKKAKSLEFFLFNESKFPSYNQITKVESISKKQTPSKIRTVLALWIDASCEWFFIHMHKFYKLSVKVFKRVRQYSEHFLSHKTIFHISYIL